MCTSSANELRARCRGISAGIFAAPLDNLGEAARRLAGWGGRILHFDVMDGVFVPQMTAGPGFVKALGEGMLRDVHLMVARPDEHVAAFAEAGADIITVHAEATAAARALAAIRAASSDLGRPILAGLATMPDTPLDRVKRLLQLAPDLILVLALDPRIDERPNLAEAGARLRVLRDMSAPERPLMAIDGGVTVATITDAAIAGPDIIVSGSAIFRAPAPEVAFHHLAAMAKTPAPDSENFHAG